MSRFGQVLLLQARGFATSRARLRPTLSAAYTSKDLWDDRFHCGLLNDQALIKTINNKILSDDALTNLEVDVFINIAAPRKGELAQLQEAVKTLRTFRKSVHTHTLLSSTPHAVCRLFLDSGHLGSLVNMLERRVEFGIFPDHFALNLLFDRALELEQYATACRLGALIMLQEEFGLNPLSDNFALYSVAKYAESQTDFSDWRKGPATASDSIFGSALEGSATSQTSESKSRGNSNEDSASANNNDGGEEEDEEEEDAEYIRVPFLRNPYHDNHFDLTHPRQICGKTLSMLARHLATGDQRDSLASLSAKCRVLGDILHGNWADASEALALCAQSRVQVDDKFVETCKFYVENLHELPVGPRPDEKTQQALLARLDKLARGGASLSAESEARHEALRDQEARDIEQLRCDLGHWSAERAAVLRGLEELAAKKLLVEEIRAKKRELKHREEYLFFYDNLKKRNLARIVYD